MGPQINTVSVVFSTRCSKYRKNNNSLRRARTRSSARTVRLLVRDPLVRPLRVWILYALAHARVARRVRSSPARCLVVVASRETRGGFQPHTHSARVVPSVCTHPTLPDTIARRSVGRRSRSSLCVSVRVNTHTYTHTHRANINIHNQISGFRVVWICGPQVQTRTTK